MINLTINNKTFEIISCTRMRDAKRGFYLDIKMNRSEISMDELAILFNNNLNTILVEDNDGVTNEYSGFRQLDSLSLENGIYHIIQVCTSEYEAQLSLAQTKINTQETLIYELEKTIAEQKNELETQAEVIVAQGDTIATQEDIVLIQSKQVEFLVEQNANYLETLDFILTDGMTLVAEEAALLAVQKVLDELKVDDLDDLDGSDVLNDSEN